MGRGSNRTGVLSLSQISRGLAASLYIWYIVSPCWVTLLFPPVHPCNHRHYHIIIELSIEFNIYLGFVCVRAHTSMRMRSCTGVFGLSKYISFRWVWHKERRLPVLRIRLQGNKAKMCARCEDELHYCWWSATNFTIIQFDNDLIRLFLFWVY